MFDNWKQNSVHEIETRVCFNPFFEMWMVCYSQEIVMDCPEQYFNMLGDLQLL